MQLCGTLKMDYLSNVTAANKAISLVLSPSSHQSVGLDAEIPADSTVIHQERYISSRSVMIPEEY